MEALFNIPEKSKVLPITTLDYRIMIQKPKLFSKKCHLYGKSNFDLTENLNFSFDVFMEHLRTYFSEDKIISMEALGDCHPGFLTIFQSLYSVYTVLTNMPACNQRNMSINIFLHRVIVVRILINDINTMVNNKPHLKYYYHEPYSDMIHRMQQLNMKIHYVGVLNQYMANFNSMYKITLPLFQEANSHSYVGSTKLISNQGYGTFFEGTDNIKETNVLDDTDSSIVFHCSRKHRCQVWFGEQSIKSVFEELIKNCELTFTVGYPNNRPIVIAKCPNNLHLLGKIKKGVEYELYEKCCNKEIDLQNLPTMKIIMKNNKLSYMNHQQMQEYMMFYKNLLNANKTATFEKSSIKNPKIFFCPSEKCIGSNIGFVSENTLNVDCTVCRKTFCSKCNVFETHSIDGTHCERIIEYGPGTKPCPNCNIPIFLTEGCDKMICDPYVGGCNTSFCWVCEKKTCLQRSDLIKIQDDFKRRGTPITYGIDDDLRAFLYLHPSNDCVNSSVGGVFYSWTNVRAWIESDIHYTATGFPLTFEDANIIETMMNQAASANTI